jgi:Domain of unknown function (DUF4823)
VVARMVRFVFVLVVGVLSGCSHTYEVTSGSQAGESHALSRDSGVLVGVPADGRYEDQSYDGSGQMVGNAIVKAFLPYTSNVRSAEPEATHDELIEAAGDQGIPYVLLPEILHWEERATEWSGRRDRIEVRLDLINASTNDTLDTAVISGKSRLMTFGGDHPQDLLRVPLEEYASEVFGG